jgi:hypothetical protein
MQNPDRSAYDTESNYPCTEAEHDADISVIIQAAIKVQRVVRVPPLPNLPRPFSH